MLSSTDIDLANPAVLLWMAQALERRIRRWEKAPHAPPSTSRAYSMDRRGILSNSGISLSTAGLEASRNRIQQGDQNVSHEYVAARATMRLGDVKRAQGHFDEAIKRYEEVLQVKEWKGELWPEALYFVGESLSEQGKEKEGICLLPAHLCPLSPLQGMDRQSLSALRRNLREAGLER